MKEMDIFRNKHGGDTLLQEYVIFILLDLVALSVLLTFLSSQGNGAIVLEQSYAKNIALLIDASTPKMDMKINMEEAFDLAEKKGIGRDDIVKIENNTVIVKLSADGGYSYSFFNNVDVTAYADIYPNKNLIIKINGYK
ncbi:hypothetical protein M0R72_05095 [Candidatus Pacearchaeota archaeon]|jgi:hypothetical protein|nr:hypothetical protein [Candidatus Pacearchaeota archaeon]